MYKLVAADTDAIKIARQDESELTDSELDEILDHLNSFTPDLIKLEQDGYYSKFIVLKSKNYVMYADGKVKLKGSSLIDQKKEPALREMLTKMIEALIHNTDNLSEIYLNYVREAMNIKDITRWSVKKTVTKPVLEGGDEDARLNERKVLDAMNGAIKSGVVENYQEGDKVWVYTAVDGEIQVKAKGELVFYKDGRPKMKPNDILKVKELWVPGTEDKDHYVHRVYQTVKIMENVLEMEKFKDFTKKVNKAELTFVSK